MLGKLMKHEILATYRVYVSMYAAMLILAVLASLASLGEDRSLVADAIAGLVSSVMMLLVGAMGMFTVYNLIMSLGQRVYGKPGYLLFAIPVKTWQIMLAKGLVNAMWIVCTSVISLLSIDLMSTIVGGMTFGELLGDMFSTVPFDAGFIAPAAASVLLYLVYYVMFFMFLFALLNLIYKGERKLLIGVLLYFGVSTAIDTVISMILGTYISIAFYGFGSIGSADLWVVAAVYLVVDALLIYFTHVMMSRKMELQ